MNSRYPIYPPFYIPQLPCRMADSAANHLRSLPVYLKQWIATQRRLAQDRNIFDNHTPASKLFHESTYRFQGESARMDLITAWYNIDKQLHWCKMYDKGLIGETDG